MPPADGVLNRIGCVVLAYGRDELHGPLVEDLLATGVSPDDIVVVHNPAGRDDPVPPPAAVEVIEMERNAGYAGGMNVGIRHHLERGCPSVLLLTHDVRFQDGSLRILLGASSPEYSVLGPAIQWDAETMCFGGVRDRHGGVDLRTAVPAGCDGADIIDCDWIEGSAILVRADVFDQVGLLDERFFMYFEEIELCFRVAQAGGKMGVLRRAVAEQEHGGVRRPELHAYLMTRNGLEFARRAAGARGVVAAAGRTLAVIWHQVRIMGGRRAKAAQRRRAGYVLAAIGRGLGAFILYRFGPPPPSINRELPA